MARSHKEDVWSKGLGEKTMEIRNEIEETIKVCGIDRSRFHEVSKQSYQSILNKIEEKFVDKSGRNGFGWKDTIHWANMGYYSKKVTLAFAFIIPESNPLWYKVLPNIVEDPNEAVWVLIEGLHKYWVYEACLPELIQVLDNTSRNDFYIVSKKLAWLISENHHDVVSFVGTGLNLQDPSFQPFRENSAFREDI